MGGLGPRNFPGHLMPDKPRKRRPSRWTIDQALRRVVKQEARIARIGARWEAEFKRCTRCSG